MKRVAVLVVLLSACGGVDDLLDAGTGGGSGGGGTSVSTGGGAGGGSSSATCTDTFAAYGQGFFATYCTACHHHSGDFSTQATVQASLSSIRSEISTGKMPEGTSLSSTEKARVLAWLNCGAP